MTRLPTVLLSLAVLLVAVAIPFAAAAPGGTGTADGQMALQTGNGSSDDETAPGATLNGALGSEEAELDGEFERRSLDRAITAATTADGRADVVAARLAVVEERLSALEDRQERLEAARDNGSISEAEYQARMTVLAAEARSLDRLGDRTAVYADALPPEALAERDVTPDRMADLRTRTANLSTFDRDLFEGAYGNRTLPDGGLDEPFETGTPDDSWWNGTDWNATDGFDWNGTAWNGTDWNTSGWNGTDWGGSGWNETDWNATDGFDWNATDGFDWNGTAWNGTDWNTSGWNGTDWDGSGWNETDWNRTDD